MESLRVFVSFKFYFMRKKCICIVGVRVFLGGRLVSRSAGVEDSSRFAEIEIGLSIRHGRKQVAIGKLTLQLSRVTWRLLRESGSGI